MAGIRLFSLWISVWQKEIYAKCSWHNISGDIRDVILLNSVIPARASRAVCHGMTPLNSMYDWMPILFLSAQLLEDIKEC